MFKLNKTDKEILVILKEVFSIKNSNPLASDDNMRLFIIRSLFLTSVVTLIARVSLWASNAEVNAEYSAIVALPIALFFGVLFLHINNKVKNTSLIIFVLTWISIVLGLYV